MPPAPWPPQNGLHVLVWGQATFLALLVAGIALELRSAAIKWWGRRQRRQGRK